MFRTALSTIALAMVATSAVAQNDLFSNNNLNDLLNGPQSKPRVNSAPVQKGKVTTDDIATIVRSAGYKVLTTTKVFVKFEYYVKMKGGAVTIPVYVEVSKGGTVVYFSMNLRSLGANPSAAKMRGLMAANLTGTYFFALRGPRNIVVLNRTIMARDISVKELQFNLRGAGAFCEKHRALWDSAPKSTAHVGIWRSQSAGGMTVVLGLKDNGQFLLKTRNAAGEIKDASGTYTLSGGRLTISAGGVTIGGTANFNGTTFIWTKDVGGTGTMTFTKYNPQTGA